MKTDLKNQPRMFDAAGIEMHDYGKIFLDDDEMVTFVTKSGRELDFSAKNWGFYLGTSLNGRLKREGFKTALVMNVEHDKIFVMSVEEDKIDIFKQYLSSHLDQKILCWLDDWIIPVK